MKFGAMELVLILVIILILFGVGKLPQVMKSLGGGLKEFKKAARGEGEDGDDKKKEDKG